MTQQPAQIVIVGSGISGLSAAWTLQQDQTAPEHHVTIVEAANRVGGKVRTETVSVPGAGEFLVEAGPDSFITMKPAGVKLARELGLEAELLGANDRQRQVYLLQNGRPVPLPDGVMLIVPTKIRPFALSPLISPLGKLRMAMDWVLPAKTDDADETVADFVRRRIGQEALDKLAEPLLAGIYNAEAEQQSLLATFPRFRHIEQQHGSLIRGMLAARKHKPAGHHSKTSMFTSFQGGTQRLTDALAERLTANIRLNRRVRRIWPTTSGAYTLELHNGALLHADAVILTTPADATARLIQPLAQDAAHLLERIRAVSTGTISLAYRSDDITHKLDGFGVVIPKTERRPINAITVSSTKFDHRAPDGYTLLRVFFGGSRSPQTMELDDAQLLKTARDELRGILGIEAEPLFHRIYRWPRANPQYDVGHLELVERIESALPPGIFVTGSAYRGVGLPDCILQAQQTAARLLTHLTRSNDERTSEIEHHPASSL